jgi:putative flavoprotein involved in K+ transport
MLRTDVVVIGGGQCGLVMSRSLTAHGIDHVVLERGQVGERWHSERWRSLNLLTPSSHSALPGLPHSEQEPDAFLSARMFASYLKAYARAVAAPIKRGVNVTAVEADEHRYRLSTDVGAWQSRAVVIATGACDAPYRPPMANRLSPSLLQIVPSEYRQPGQLPEGGALVVGASSTGVQLAEEIHASGRPVTLAVSDHTRVPRRYRGRDIYAWMDAAGILDDPARENGNLQAARRQPSLQLTGRPDNRDIDLGVLSRRGVRLLGRLSGIDGMKVGLAGDLGWTTARSHARMLRILDRIDLSIERLAGC